MKKLLLLLVSCLFVIPSFGQAIDTRRVEKYANALYRENGKKKWRAAASDLTKEVKFDINDNLSFVRVVECENISKDNLYMILNHWFTMTFNDANSV